LANWWQFHHKYLYLPDLFNTTVSDTEVEWRVNSYLHGLKVTPYEFDKLLDNWYFQCRVLAIAKYQANHQWTPWPIGHSSSEAQERIGKRSMMDAWSLEIPVSERQRLVSSYAGFQPQTNWPRQADLYVLAHDHLRGFLHPDQAGLQKLWENAHFEIWSKAN